MIDQELLKNSMLSALRETLEIMAFAEVIADEQVKESYLTAEGSFIWGRVGVHSKDINAAELAIPEVLASELADTMYAGMLPEGESAILDVVAELTNTFCGKLMLDLHDSQNSFVLEVPEKGKGLLKVEGDAVVCQCIVDELHRVRAVIYFDK